MPTSQVLKSSISRSSDHAAFSTVTSGIVSGSPAPLIRSAKGCAALTRIRTGARSRTYDAVVGLPIQPTISSRAASDEVGAAAGTNRVVSTQVGIIVTDG